MADPVSLVLGALPLTVQAVQASRALVGFMADIRGAPGNIKAVNKEVHAFYNVLFSLSVVLKDQDVQTAISGNNTLLKTVETLIEPIDNCRAILEQLTVKLEKLCSSCPRTYDIRSSFMGVKWSLFSKNEISKLQQNLEAEKLTISVALNVITMLTDMGVLTLTEENHASSEGPTRKNLDANAIISPFAHVSRETPLSQLLSLRTWHISDLEKTVGGLEATYVPMNQISESLGAIVHEIQYAVMSTNRVLQRKVAQVYQELSKAGLQIQELKSSIEQSKELRKGATAAASNGNM